MARSSTTFGPGNSAAKTRGQRAKKTGSSLSELDGIRARALEEYPHLANRPELRERYVHTKFHIEELRARVERLGPYDARGRVRRDLDYLHSREKDLAQVEGLIEAARATTLPAGIERWQLGRFRMGMEMATDPADLARLAKQRRELIGQGVPAELLPETQEEAARIGDARRATYAALKESVGHARALEMAKRGEV